MAEVLKWWNRILPTTWPVSERMRFRSGFEENWPGMCRALRVMVFWVVLVRASKMACLVSLKSGDDVELDGEDGDAVVGFCELGEVKVA